MSNLPFIDYKHKICIICEGDEDTEYIKRLLELRVWNDKLDFYPINSKSASNIPARYQDAFQNNKYELVIIFCDTDKSPYKEYSLVKEKINLFHGKENASEKIIIFANPCTMQIILSHFKDVSLEKQGKKTNGKIIEECTGVKNYDAHAEQIKEICQKIFRKNYTKMKERVSKINFPDTVSGSTNFATFISKFESDNIDWIKEISRYLTSD